MSKNMVIPIFHADLSDYGLRSLCVLNESASLRPFTVAKVAT
jgi:hypothetical protein